jgi:hypothetical protein
MAGWQEIQEAGSARPVILKFGAYGKIDLRKRERTFMVSNRGQGLEEWKDVAQDITRTGLQKQKNRLETENRLHGLFYPCCQWSLVHTGDKVSTSIQKENNFKFFMTRVIHYKMAQVNFMNNPTAIY